MGGTWATFDQWYPTNKDQAKVGFSLYLGNTTSISQPSSVVNPLKMAVYPNPAREQAMVRFMVSESKSVEIELLTVQGQQVVHFEQPYAQVGINHVPFSLRGISPGWYVVKLTVGEQTAWRSLSIQP